MARYMMGRVLSGMLTLAILSLIVFAASRQTGDPVVFVVGPNATPEQREAASKQLGLDKPLMVQYLNWAKDALHGDFGRSTTGSRAASDLFINRFPATVRLAGAAMAFAVPLGLLLGVLGAIYKDRWPDALSRTVAILGQSLPPFWVGLMLMLIFSVRLDVLPAAGDGGPSHYVLPAVTIGMFLVAAICRITRSSMIEVLGNDYIRTSRAKGLAEHTVILRHAVHNAAIPVVTILSLMFAFSLTGSIVAETIFAWPGVGRLAFQSIASRDFPVIQVIALAYGAIFITVNFITDMLYGFIDPRISHS